MPGPGARLGDVVWRLCGAEHSRHNLFELSPQSSANRAMQSRLFETGADHELLSASAASLQDLGFQIEESVREVGLLRAAKERSAREYGQYRNRFLIRLCRSVTWSFPSICIRKLPRRLSSVRRTTVTRGRKSGSSSIGVIWKGDGQADRNYIPPGEQRKMEMIQDPEIYQEFFAKLSKAVFLEPHSI
ncbi:MAG: hypothetical protein QM771_04950 [Nitrospira sp.]